MTTTKPRSLEAELSKLKAERDKAHEAAKETKARAEAWDREVREQRLIRREANPNQAAHDEAVKRFHAADDAYREFKTEHLHDRLAEIDPDIDRALEEIRSTAAALATACDSYKATVERTRAVVSDTPTLDRESATRPHLEFDSRVSNWREYATEIRDAEISRPGLTEVAAWKVAQIG